MIYIYELEESQNKVRLNRYASVNLEQLTEEKLQVLLPENVSSYGYENTVKEHELISAVQSGIAVQHVGRVCFPFLNIVFTVFSVTA